MKTKEQKAEEIMQLSMSGMSARQIAIKLSYSASTVNRYLREYRSNKTYNISEMESIILDADTFNSIVNESVWQDIALNEITVTAIKMYCTIVNAYRDTGSIEVNLAPFLPKL